MGIKFLSITDFDREGKAGANKPIWAINTSEKSLAGQAGEVIIMVARPEGGQPDPLRIDQTWLPQELTRDIPRARLLRTTAFRQAVSRDLIGLIDEDTANRLLRQDGAIEEKERLREQERSIRKAGAARTIKDSKAEVHLADGSDADADDNEDNGMVSISTGHDRSESAAKQALKGVEDVEPGVSPQFKMWIDKLNTGSDNGAKAAIRARGKFKKTELGFMSRHLKSSFSDSLRMVNATIKKN